MTEESDLLVHDVIGRLFEEPEPLHRADLADGAIAHGMAVTRRRGFAVAGATLSVLAVVAGAAVVAGGRGTGNDWSLSPDARQLSPQAFEDPAPSYSDRQREIMAQLPGVLGPLLPAGMTLSRDPEHSIGGTSMLTGDFGPEFLLRSGGTTYYLAIDPDGSGSPNAPAKPVAVTGGSILTPVTRTQDPQSGRTDISAWYQFVPSDAAVPRFSFSVNGPGDTVPIDTAAFKKMVEAPGFAKVRQLLDPSVQASAAAVKHRYALEAQINAEAARILPPGFRLKLNPGAPGMIELVGPEGVNTFDWWAFSDPKPQDVCGAGSLCYAPDHDKKSRTVGPDGVARLGVYWSGSGTPADPEISFSIFGTPRTGKSVQTDWPILGKDGSETAPQGPGLTPQQARAIMKAPGAAKVITDVQKLVTQG